MQSAEEISLLETIIVKSMSWNYENEYRRIFDFSKQRIKLKEIGLVVEGVIFGNRCISKNKDDLIEICKVCDLRWGDIILSNSLECEVLKFCTTEQYLRMELKQESEDDFYKYTRDVFDPQLLMDYASELNENKKIYKNANRFKETSEFQSHQLKMDKLKKKLESIN